MRTANQLLNRKTWSFLVIAKNRGWNGSVWTKKRLIVLWFRSPIGLVVQLVRDLVWFKTWNHIELTETKPRFEWFGVVFPFSTRDRFAWILRWQGYSVVHGQIINSTFYWSGLVCIRMSVRAFPLSCRSRWTLSLFTLERKRYSPSDNVAIVQIRIEKEPFILSWKCATIHGTYLL